MKYEILYTSRFKKDYRVALKRGNHLASLKEVIETLANGESLPIRCNDHALSGDYSGYRECHVHPDWLLIYKRNDSFLLLTLYRTGTHSDLF